MHQDIHWQQLVPDGSIAGDTSNSSEAAVSVEACDECLKAVHVSCKSVDVTLGAINWMYSGYCHELCAHCGLMVSSRFEGLAPNLQCLFL